MTAHLAADLNLIRRGAGLSYRQLARVTGCPASTLNDALAGRRFPRLDTVLAIVRACGGDEGQWRERWLRADARRTGSAGKPPAAFGTSAPAGDPSAVRAAPVRDLPVPVELPHAVRGFAGRGDELAQLRALRASNRYPHAPVICLIDGMAGVGKTALALHWAHEVAAEFPDGQLFLGLRGHDPHCDTVSATEALDQLLRSLGAAPERIPADPARLYRTLSAGKRLLVVLDDAVSSEQVRPLLPGSPGCLVIVTSRWKLAGLVAGEGADRLQLGPLPPAQSRALLVQALGRERIELDPAGADALAAACGHLPLALRIAAAHLITSRYQRIADLVARLSDGDLLTDLRTDGDDHSGLRLAFDLSYRALGDAARRLFRLLGLIPGADFTADAATALAGTDGTQLDMLGDAHLVDQPIPGRYRLHDLLRRYAEERAVAELAPAEREAAVRRLAHWYLRTADAAARTLYPESLRLAYTQDLATAPATGFTAADEALAWLDAELANLVATVQYTAAQGPHAVAWLLADTLRGYFNLRLHRREWYATATAGLLAAEHCDDRRARAAMRHSLGLAHSRLGSNADAVTQFGHALAEYRELDDAEGAATVLICIGGAYRQLGRVDRAAPALQESLALCQRVQLPVRAAACLGDLGEVYRDQGRLVEALRCQRQAIELFRRLASPRGEALATLALGSAHHQLGELDEALRYQSRALAILRTIGSRDGEAYALLSLAEVHRDLGADEQAGRHAAAALALADDLGDDALTVEARLAAAAVLPATVAAGEAATHCRSALRLARRARYRHGEVKALAGLASAELRLGRPDRALRHCDRALALARRAGYRLVEARVLALTAEARRQSATVDRLPSATVDRLQSTTGARRPEATNATLGSSTRQPSSDGR
jgi:tetratricopeptide (TPR) repeat protein